MNLAIIPARGGSKRIPRKNIKLFFDKPMIVYAIENAINSGLFDEVMVSTEDSEIAEIAIKHGAKVPFIRSKKNADDYATTSDVLLEVLLHYQQNNNPVSIACCLYPTAPLIESKDLIEGKNTFDLNHFDTLFSAVKFDFPIQRAFQLNENNKINLLEPESIHQRSQDLVPYFHDAGAFYFFKAAIFIQNKTLWSANIGAFILPNSKVQDIDHPEDWELAIIKYERLHQK